MNIVFLDFDGVVNTPIWDYDKKGKLRCDFNHPSDRKLNNFQSICWLNEYCTKTNSSIVVSSTWRRGGLDFMKECLYKTGLNTNIKVIGVTSHMSYRYDHNFGSDVGRGLEIYQYLLDNPNIEKFIILDDDSDMGSLEKYLVKCNCMIGFSFPEYALALEKFEAQASYEWMDIESYETKKFIYNPRR